MPRKLFYYCEIKCSITSLERIDFDLTIAASTVTVIESSSEPTYDLGVSSVRSFYREILAQMPRKLSYYPEINYGKTSLEPTDFDLATAEDVVTVVESSSEPTLKGGF